MSLPHRDIHLRQKTTVQTFSSVSRSKTKIKVFLPDKSFVCIVKKKWYRRQKAEDECIVTSQLQGSWFNRWLLTVQCFCQKHLKIFRSLCNKVIACFESCGLKHSPGCIPAYAKSSQNKLQIHLIGKLKKLLFSVLKMLFTTEQVWFC